MRKPITAADVVAAADTVDQALRAAVAQDWSVPAGDVQWTCADTAGHLGGCLIAYASQLAVQPTDRYVGFTAFADDDATAIHQLEFIRAGARLLATMVGTAPPNTRAFHPYGVSDPEGFAGMGCVEMLVHGYDIATGLGLPFTPPSDLCQRTLARMFPDLDPGHTDPWSALRYATGRLALPGRPPVTTWRWRGEPLE